MKKIIISSTLAILFVICGMAGISEALPIFLTDAGWSDPNVGTWDAVTRTATLTTDINQTIQIDTNNITLDGNGHTITGESIGYGVILSERSGITITNLNVQQFDFGIYLNHSIGNTLIGNTVSSNDFGIQIQFSSSNNSITNNTVTSNNNEGIYLWSSSSNTLTNNTTSNNGFGISLNSSSNNTLIGNTSDSNDNYGIHLFNSDGNTLANNTFTSNNWSGIFLSSSDNNTITNNTTSNNSQDGIGLSSSSSNTLTNNTVTSNNGYNGIGLSSSSSNTLTNNTVTLNNGFGIGLSSSSSNTLSNNTVTLNNGPGIALHSFGGLSSSNTITNNTVILNSWDGISLHSSVDNILTNNTASNNGWSGIYLYSSSNNKIYNNNFIGNATQAYVDGGSSNVFNLDKPVGGNYWSNWTTPDSDGDGFVDIPFVFSGGQDNFPSVEQYHSSSIIPSRGGNAGQVSVTIFGSNFVDGTSAKLVCDSQEIIGENTVILSSHRLSTTFNLVGAPPGPCDLVVTLPDNSQFLCEDCFTVEEGGEAKLWVGIVGRDQIRPGRTVTYMVHYGNMGNLDAEEVLAFYLLDPQFEYITNSPDGKYDDFFKAVDWMLGRIPPAFTGYLNITVKVNDSVQPQTTVESFVYVVNIEPVQNQPANHNTEALIQQTSSSQVNLFLNGIDLQFGTNWARKYDEFAIRVNAAWIPVYYSGSIALDVIHVENATPGSPGFPVIPTDYNGLTQPLVVNHLYDTVFAYSGGTRTALSAIRLYNLRCKRLVLISPMSGLQSPGMYKWELEQILSQGFVQEIVIYQSENDKDLPFDNLYQVKFDQNDPWLYGKNVKVNPSNFYMDGRVVTIDEQEINKQSHGGLFLYINRRVSKGPEDQTSSSIKSTVVTELVRKNWTET